MPPPQPSTTHGGSQPSTISLSHQTMSRLKAAKIFNNCIDPPEQLNVNPQKSPANAPPRSVTGITFDDRGDQVVMAAEDESFRLYNCKNGKHVKTLYSKKYGIDLPRFTHKNTTIIYASTKEDDTIRYSSLHDNKFLQYFKGHKGLVVSLEVSPIDDGFMSGSMDKTVRLWDLRSPTCRGMLTAPTTPIVAYDSTGMVFAVGITEYQRILLYDQANYDKAPFLTIFLQDPSLERISYPPRMICITSLSFSLNAKYLLVGCSGPAHYILDAFTGGVVAKLEGHFGLERKSMNVSVGIDPERGISREEVSWTPDSKYVVGGSLDGKICIWDLQNLPPHGEVGMLPLRVPPMATLDGHTGPVRCVKFNPRFAMMCTAGHELAFWLPDASVEGEDGGKDLLKKKGMA